MEFYNTCLFCIESELTVRREYYYGTDVGNMAHLRRCVEALNAGKGIEHDIIEIDG